MAKKPAKKKPAKKKAAKYNTDKLKIIGTLDQGLKVSLLSKKRI